MQYTVVHSTDPYLLARLATDLQMEGIETTKGYWNNEYNPFSHLVEGSGQFPNSWCLIYPTFFEFHNHDGNGPEREALHELTSRNYIKVLTKILEP